MSEEYKIIGEVNERLVTFQHIFPCDIVIRWKKI